MRSVVSLSLPPKMEKEVERIAKIERRSKSELILEAVRQYLAAQQWKDLQRYGARRAKSLRLTEADVERLVDEVRR
jgi:metal-responsive CopG/Arc/MetJ family transcriptional regulator